MGIKLNNETYDFMKWFTMIALPAFSAAYFGMGQVLPHVFVYTTEVVGSIAVLITLLGSLLGLSTATHNKELKTQAEQQTSFDGVLSVESHGDPQKDVYAIELGDELENLAIKDKIVLRVQTHSEPDSQ